MLINQIINVEVTSGESPPTLEPVALSDMKDYLRVEGFTTNEDSPSDEFDFDDDLITDMISEGRMWAEEFTGVHLIPKTIQVTFRNEAGEIQLPGPATSTIALLDVSGNSVSTPTWIGTRFPILKTCYRCEIVATYNVGYSGNAPGWVLNAIMAYVAWAYEHRGDEDGIKGSPQRAASICRPHRKKPSWG